MKNLTNKQIKFLKNLAHHIKPVVMIGINGFTEGVLAEIDEALNYHELIKVKIASADRETKLRMVEAIVRESHSHQIQVIGNTLTLYRSAKSAKIMLPKS